MTTDEVYLKAILATVARQTFPPAQLADMVAPRSDSIKQIAAYNLCDGQHSQAQIATKTGLDSSNLSKAISRWVDLGIVIKVGEGSDLKPVHVYPLPAPKPEKAKAPKNG
jgi:DNA-binding MarR family transcriptional regulator